MAFSSALVGLIRAAAWLACTVVAGARRRLRAPRGGRRIVADSRSPNSISFPAEVAPAVENSENRPHTERIVGVTAAIFAGVATLLATAQGAGLGADSVNYFSAGLNLAAGNGLRTFNGTQLTMFPPGLPAIIAAGDLIGLSSQSSIRILNSLSMTATVWLGFTLLRRHVRSRGVVILTTVLLAVSVTLLGLASMALTECIFVLICLALILVLEELIAARGRPLALVAPAALLVWAGIMFRYAGIALIPAGAIAILFGRRSKGWTGALQLTLTFCVLSLVAPVLWMLRNHRVSGNYLGPRAPSPDGPVITLQRFVATLGRWVLPKPTPIPLQAAAGVALIGTCLLIAAWVLLSPQRRANLQSLLPGRYSLAPLLCSVAVYSCYLGAAQLSIAFDPIGSRLMSPIYVPLVVLLATAFDRLTEVLGEDHRRRVRRIATVVFAVFLVGQSVVFLTDARRSGSEGTEYAATSWKSSEFIAAVRDLPTDADLYSNVPAGIWAVLQREPIRRSPEKSQRRGTANIAISKEFLTRVQCNYAYLAWSQDAVGDYLYTPDELGQYVNLEVISTPEGGTVYRVLPLVSVGNSQVTC